MCVASWPGWVGTAQFRDLLFLQPSVGSVWDVLDYSRNENRGEKVKIKKTFSAADDRRRAADKKRGQSALSSWGHLQCIVGDIMDFPDLKTNTSDWLFRSNLTSRACEPRAGLISRLFNHDLGLPDFKVIRSSYIRPQIWWLILSIKFQALFMNIPLNLPPPPQYLPSPLIYSVRSHLMLFDFSLRVVNIRVILIIMPLLCGSFVFVIPLVMTDSWTWDL